MQQNIVILNGLQLEDERNGKGRYFTSKFLEPGLAKYSEPIGTILLDKQTIDNFVSSFKGCPVVIDHVDVTDGNAKEKRVGVVSNVWFCADDGWYYCDGVIYDKEALVLIEQGYTVSCAYSFKTDGQSGTWHNNEYDGKVISGDFLHLALVANPRYEDANIILNSKEELKGGEADDKTLEDIAEKHNVTLDYIKEQLEKGMEVESEHSDDKEVQKEIAKDHLFEDADYYKKLATIENEKDDTMDLLKALNELVLNFNKKGENEMVKNEAEVKEALKNAGYDDEKIENCMKVLNESEEEEKELENKKAKNEEEEEAENEEEDKKEDEKAENSMAQVKKAYNSNNVETKSLYTSQSQRLEIGKQLY